MQLSKIKMKQRKNLLKFVEEYTKMRIEVLLTTLPQNATLTQNTFSIDETGQKSISS